MLHKWRPKLKEKHRILKQRQAEKIPPPTKITTIPKQIKSIMLSTVATLDFKNIFHKLRLRSHLVIKKKQNLLLLIYLYIHYKLVEMGIWSR